MTGWRAQNSTMDRTGGSAMGRLAEIEQQYTDERGEYYDAEEYGVIEELLSRVRVAERALDDAVYGLAYFKNPHYWERVLDGHGNEVTVWRGSSNDEPWLLFDESAPRGEGTSDEMVTAYHQKYPRE
ncbi:MAG: hypothetical protein ACR2P5_05465 [Gammaproteobacteria bacterium]